MRIGIGLAVLAAMLSTVAKASVVEEFKAEDWDGLAFTSNETGKFTHCSVYAAYRNGSTLYISYEVDDAWFFSVANDSWSLTEGGNFAIKFKVDRRGEIDGTGTALGPTQIGLPVETDHPFVGQLRRGNQLVISFQNADYAFELSNSNKAMNAAQECVGRHVRLGTHTPIVSSGPDAPPLPQESQQAQQAPTEEPAPEESTADSDASDTPAAAAGEQQQFGPWVVTATHDGAGDFVNCTAYGVHGDDQLILSYFPDDVWTFGLYRTAWNLKANESYSLSYNVDGPADAQSAIKVAVEATEPTRIFFEMNQLEDLIQRIENGKILNLQLHAPSGTPESYSYPLDQADDAFEATRKCVRDHAAAPPAASSEETEVKEEAVAPDAGPSGEDSAADSGPATPLPQIGSTVIETLEVPGWEAAAFSEAGAFTHCGIKAEYQNGATFGVARAANGDLLLAIQHDDWSLQEGGWVPISYKLAGDTPLDNSGEGWVAAKNLIMTVMGSTESLALALKAAPQMDISTEGKDLSFDISDIAPGITAIDECVARHAAAIPTPKPAAKKKVEAEPAPEAGAGTDSELSSTNNVSTPAETPVAPSGPDTLPPQEEVALSASGERTEAAGYTTALLLRSGYPNHIILSADAAISGDVPPGDAVWELGKVMGSTHIANSATPEDIKSSISGGLLEKCSGVLTTRIVNSDPTHMHFTLQCGAAAPKLTQYVVLPRDAGGSYVFALIGPPLDGMAGSIAEAVYEKAIGG